MEIHDLLRQRHHLQPAQENDFSVRNLEEVFAPQETSARIMSIRLGTIASVSVVVGGIGIMNIMLASLTERTGEIGLRQSVQPEKMPDRFALLSEQGVPFVLIDRFFPGTEFPCVRTDGEAVGRLATQHLIDLGHTRIAHIAGPSVSAAALRRIGYHQALAAAGVTPTEQWIPTADFEAESGRRAMK